MKKEAKSLKGLYILIALVMIVGIFVVLSVYFLNLNQKQQEVIQPIIYKNMKLHVFGETLPLKDDDSIFVHENYLLVVRPFEGETRIYSLSTHKRIGTKQQLALDFDGKNLLYNQNGADTYFNGIRIQKKCYGGYIKSNNEILCITPKKTDPLDNELLLINPQTGDEKIIYSSSFTLNSVTIIKNNVYIGGFVLETHKPVLIYNNSFINLPYRADVIYPLSKSIYIGSFPNGFNNNTESYALLEKQNNTLTATTIQKGEIIFYGDTGTKN